MKSQYEHIIHPFPPLYDNNSKILILGSLPSVKSREQMFFYGHPQNRFWKVITAVINNSGMNDKNIEVPVTIEEKKMMLHNNHIALWDTIYSCDIIGSSDSSIKNVVPTDLGQIISNSRIERVYCMVQLQVIITKSTSRRCWVLKLLFFRPQALLMRHIHWTGSLEYGVEQ